MKNVWLSIVLVFLTSAYGDQLVVTVTDEGVSVPATFESGYTSLC